MKMKAVFCHSCVRRFKNNGDIPNSSGNRRRLAVSPFVSLTKPNINGSQVLAAFEEVKLRCGGGTTQRHTFQKSSLWSTNSRPGGPRPYRHVVSCRVSRHVWHVTLQQYWKVQLHATLTTVCRLRTLRPQHRVRQSSGPCEPSLQSRPLVPSDPVRRSGSQ